MSSISNYGRGYITKTLFGRSLNPNGTYFIAALKSSPNSASTGSTLNEPTAVSYARVAYANTSANWSASGSGSITNTNKIKFNVATQDWGLITHYALCDSFSGGNLFIFGTLTTKLFIANGDNLIIDSYGITISVNS